MKYFFRDNNSKKLLLFFTGWGCDEFQFNHLSYSGDVLFLYNYNDLKLDFEFNKYKEIIVLSYSAGVFVSSVFPVKIPNITKRIIVDGNPYLFDEILGVPTDVVKIFKNVNEENCLDFRRDYLVATRSEMELFAQNQPHRGFEDCLKELLDLEKLYKTYKNKINLKYDVVVFGENDPIFLPINQKKFYKNSFKTVLGAKHNIFFRFNSFDEIIKFALE